jgi:hypothetical protein
MAGLLPMSLVLAAFPLWAGEKTETKSNTENTQGTGIVPQAQGELICKRVAEMINKKTIEKYSLKARDITPSSSEYNNIDIDGDGKADTLTVDSGSSGSYLTVQLSTGNKYDLEPGGFVMVVQIRGRVYALVTRWKWTKQQDDSIKGKQSRRSLYILKRNGIELVCQDILREY